LADRANRRNGPICCGAASSNRPAERLLVTLTAFAGLTTSVFLAAHMRVEATRQMDARRASAVHICTSCSASDAAGADDQQHAMSGSRWSRDLTPCCWSRLPHRGHREAAGSTSSCARGHRAGAVRPVLLYMAAERSSARGGPCCGPTRRREPARPNTSRVHSPSCSSHGTKVGLGRCTTGCRRPREGRHRCRRCVGLLLNVALYAVLRCKVRPRCAGQQPPSAG